VEAKKHRPILCCFNLFDFEVYRRSHTLNYSPVVLSVLSYMLYPVRQMPNNIKRLKGCG